MRTITFLAARGVVIDRKSNNVSVFNLVEQVNAASAPVLFQSLAVLYMAERSAEEQERWPAKLTLSINGKQLGAFAAEMNFDGKPRTRLVVEIGTLVIPELGRLLLEFTVGEKVSAAYEIEVAANAELTKAPKLLFQPATTGESVEQVSLRHKTPPKPRAEGKSKAKRKPRIQTVKG